MRMTISGLVLALAVSSGAHGQSSNPFGIPTADNPQPAARIAAAPGSRAQGWLRQGRSEILARHGVVASGSLVAT
ncbi:MAG: gamma-glutamyltransferase, partial [Pseudomonadota bacterium]